MDNKDKKGFYLTLYAVATVFLLMAFGITILNSSNNNEADIPQENAAPVEKSNVKPVIETTTAAHTEAETQTTKETADTAKKEPETEIVTTAQSELSLFNDDDEMTWPVSGQILMDYNMDSAIYDKTLEQYRTNDSISISAPLGTEVCVSADGVVTAVTKDEEKGVSVSVDHGNGWMSTYSQLQDNLKISEGQTVYQGDVIGNIAEPSKYSTALGPHLEFSVFKDDKATDPKLVLAALD